MHDGDRRQRDGLSLPLELIDAAQAERVRARPGPPAPGAGEPAAGRCARSCCRPSTGRCRSW
ncbi:hypothetical protein ACTPOK_06470 [Streptomyces inhibens]|uniref:hypothetical protein n=1 Tax=Streptomyces inhibens TaxID=2293571 RepID=UPI00402AB2EE